MYRLLIVDDEAYVIEMLLDLFETKFHDEELEIFTAANGAVALDLLQTYKIDVMLLDINMPGINGFEVARQVKRNWSDCNIIFLTGSDSFDAIYEATKQKNITYLLKTEEDEVILKAVRDTIASVAERQRDMNLIQLSHQREFWVHYLVTREVFKSLMNGRDLHKIISSNGISKSDFRINVDGPVFCLYTNIRFETPTLSMLKDKSHLLKIQACLEQVLQRRFHIDMYLKDTSTLLFFLQPKAETFKGLDIEPYVFLSESLDSFGLSLNAQFRIIPLMLLYTDSVPVAGLPSLIRKLDGYHSRNYVNTAPTTALAQVVDADMLVAQKDANPITLSAKTQEKIQSIEFLLYQQNLHDLTELLTELEQTKFTHNSMHHLQSIELYQMISLHYLHYINHLQLNESLAPQIGVSSLFFLGNFQHWGQAFDYLKKLSKVIVSTVTANAYDKNDLLIMSIKKYINDHLDKNLTLSAIANHVNYNSSYVSRTFKKQTGMSITEFIRETKVSKAKSDLIGTNKSISEISSELGFEASQYFSITFKKATGISPTEYRSKNMLHH